MTTAPPKWPPWATLRADEIRATLPAEEWGPWDHRGPCLLSNNNIGSNQMPPHQTEAPHFFYCKPHLQAIKERNSTVKPWPTRDQGLCSSCGGAAALLPVTMADPVACVQAEKTNSTVARLKTARRCRDCQVSNHPACRGRTCRTAGKTPPADTARRLLQADGQQHQTTLQTLLLCQTRKPTSAPRQATSQPCRTRVRQGKAKKTRRTT